MNQKVKAFWQNTTPTFSEPRVVNLERGVFAYGLAILGAGPADSINFETEAKEMIWEYSNRGIGERSQSSSKSSKFSQNHLLMLTFPLCAPSWRVPGKRGGARGRGICSH